MSRTYDMTVRARRAAETADRIVDTTERLLASGSLRDVTLQTIADGAGVTVQTVLRHMGSRDGCLRAVGERVSGRVDAQRGECEPGDVRRALADLVAHYEAEGRLVLNLVAQEDGDEPLARQAAHAGREYHRAWVVRCLGPALAEPDPVAIDPVAIDALVAATDLYVWKLLRLDLGRSVEATEAVMARLVRSVLEGAR